MPLGLPPPARRMFALSLSSIRWRRGPGRGGASKKPPSPTLPPLVPRGERESRIGLNRYLGLPTRGGDGSWLGRSRRVSLGVFIRIFNFIPLCFSFSFWLRHRACR